MLGILGQSNPPSGHSRHSRGWVFLANKNRPSRVSIPGDSREWHRRRGYLTPSPIHDSFVNRTSRGDSTSRGEITWISTADYSRVSRNRSLRRMPSIPRSQPAVAPANHGLFNRFLSSRLHGNSDRLLRTSIELYESVRLAFKVFKSVFVRLLINHLCNLFVFFLSESLVKALRQIRAIIQTVVQIRYFYFTYWCEFAQLFMFPSMYERFGCLFCT